MIKGLFNRFKNKALSQQKTEKIDNDIVEELIRISNDISDTKLKEEQRREDVVNKTIVKDTYNRICADCLIAAQQGYNAIEYIEGTIKLFKHVNPDFTNDMYESKKKELSVLLQEAGFDFIIAQDKCVICWGVKIEDTDCNIKPHWIFLDI